MGLRRRGLYLHLRELKADLAWLTLHGVCGVRAQIHDDLSAAHEAQASVGTISSKQRRVVELARPPERAVVGGRHSLHGFIELALKLGAIRRAIFPATDARVSAA